MWMASSRTALCRSTPCLGGSFRAIQTYFCGSDAGRSDHYLWSNCVYDYELNPLGGYDGAFSSGGAGITTLAIDNLTSHGGVVTCGAGAAAPMSSTSSAAGTTTQLSASSSFTPSGVLIDHAMLTGSTYTELRCSNSIVQNCQILQSGAAPGGNAWFGVSVIGAASQTNTIRFNTMVMSNAAAGNSTFITLRDNGTNTSFLRQHPVRRGPDRAVALWNQATPTANDIAYADYNFYDGKANFVLTFTTNNTLTQWQAFGFDAHSQSGDPQFTDPLDAVYTLSATSPCVDAALVAANDVPATDFDGVSRPQGPAADIGAFERLVVTAVTKHPPVIGTVTALPTPVSTGTTVTFTATATDADNDTLAYAWDFGDGTTGTGAQATHAYTNAGTYTATVTVSDGNGGTATDTANVTVTGPSITSVSPNTGPAAGLQTVTLTGTNLSGATAITFGGVTAASPISNTATQIVVTTPAHAAGEWWMSS